jgi:hypothetical protein
LKGVGKTFLYHERDIVVAVVRRGRLLLHIYDQMDPDAKVRERQTKLAEFPAVELSHLGVDECEGQEVNTYNVMTGDSTFLYSFPCILDGKPERATLDYWEGKLRINVGENQVSVAVVEAPAPLSALRVNGRHLFVAFGRGDGETTEYHLFELVGKEVKDLGALPLTGECMQFEIVGDRLYYLRKSVQKYAVESVSVAALLYPVISVVAPTPEKINMEKPKEDDTESIQSIQSMVSVQMSDVLES